MLKSHIFHPQNKNQVKVKRRISDLAKIGDFAPKKDQKALKLYLKCWMCCSNPKNQTPRQKIKQMCFPQAENQTDASGPGGRHLDFLDTR